MTRTSFFPIAMLCVASLASGQEFKPSPLQPAVIRSWGDDSMSGVMSSWEQGFRKYHPEITFQDKLIGSGTGMAGTITGTSDLSLMGRPVTANEVIGFEWVHRVKPLGFAVLNGKSGEGKSAPLAVYVSARNPLQSVSMAQLAAVLGCPATQANVTWAMAGASGEWAKKPLHAYVYDNQTGTGAFLQHAVIGTKDCWNWSVVREFKGELPSEQILAALKRDPNGLGVATAGTVPAGLKMIEVNGVAVTDDKYPFQRQTYLYIYRAKDKAVEPKVAEFLRFVLSDEGQAIAREQGDYSPLSEAVIAEQRKKLE